MIRSPSNKVPQKTIAGVFVFQSADGFSRGFAEHQ